MFYVSLILIISCQAYGMKRGSSPIPSNRPIKVANTQDTPLQPGPMDVERTIIERAQLNPREFEFYRKIKNGIYTADSLTFEQLLSQPQARSLSKKDKTDLYLQAKSLEEPLLTNPGLWADDLKRITTIKNCLFAYQSIPQFSFPQAFFTADPYNRPADTRPDLSLIIAGLIKNEKEKIYVCCFHFTLGSLAEALVEQKDKGVSVEIITNQSQGSNPQDKFIITNLQESGIPVLSPQNDKFEQMHHKFFIFQKNLLDKRLLVIGSYNPTKHGNTNSWDDIMILDDPAIIDQYLARFEEVKSRSK